MSATDVSIASNALLMLGKGPISSFTEVGDGALITSNLYAQLRDALLREHNWHCATKYVVLPPDAVAPPFDYTYAFSLPADWKRNVQVGQKGNPIEFRVVGNKIYADDNPLYLAYAFQNTVEATWDDLLVHAMSLKMKHAIAYAITKSATVRDDAKTELDDFLKKCRAVNGQDEPAQTLGDERLFNAGFTSGF